MKRDRRSSRQSFCRLLSGVRYSLVGYITPISLVRQSGPCRISSFKSLRDLHQPQIRPLPALLADWLPAPEHDDPVGRNARPARPLPRLRLSGPIRHIRLRAGHYLLAFFAAKSVRRGRRTNPLSHFDPGDSFFRRSRLACRRTIVAEVRMPIEEILYQAYLIVLSWPPQEETPVRGGQPACPGSAPQSRSQSAVRLVNVTGCLFPPTKSNLSEADSSGGCTS